MWAILDAVMTTVRSRRSLTLLVLWLLCAWLPWRGLVWAQPMPAVPSTTVQAAAAMPMPPCHATADAASGQDATPGDNGDREASAHPHASGSDDCRHCDLCHGAMTIAGTALAPASGYQPPRIARVPQGAADPSRAPPAPPPRG